MALGSQISSNSSSSHRRRSRRCWSCLLRPSSWFLRGLVLPACSIPPPSSRLCARFGMSHQEALAQVTAQAVQFQSQVQPHEYLPSPSTITTASQTQLPAQEVLPVTSDSENTAFESAEVSHSEHKSQSTTLADKPTDDGYNWRKYGQKQVKGSEFPRSYYKCTHPNCPVKKKVERSLEGQVTEIIYKGQHNHQRPPPNKRAKEGSALPPGSNAVNGNTDYHANSERPSQSHLNRSNDAHVSASKRGRESNYGTPEHVSGSSDGEELVEAEVRTDEADANESDMKRRNVEPKVSETASSQKTMTESRIIVQTTSEVDLLDDGYRWRKYGQKVVKGNPNPRSYYKCTYSGCNVRKHVERASTDPKAVITTYEGKHNHDVPAARSSSHNTANAAAAAAAAANIIQPKAQNQAYLNRRDFRKNNHHQAMKEEEEIT
ncbi:WRKY domain-containing protein [Dioscorea alata]|uniref:WRKY domain-containing protein n=1 Tax=Dioscorea alata TaxID=55571 RepID=A0ACB7UJQ9_DIOAL|nr:WRKY domain-containing protein [Dioscorea alata]